MFNKFKNLGKEDDALNKLKAAGLGLTGIAKPGGLRGMPL